MMQPDLLSDITDRLLALGSAMTLYKGVCETGVASVRDPSNISNGREKFQYHTSVEKLVVFHN
jgi:hypothetical protein